MNMLISIAKPYSKVTIKNMMLMLLGVLFCLSCSNDDDNTTVIITPPDNATSFTATPGDGVVELSWIAPENTVGYRLTYTPNGTDPIYLRRDVTSKTIEGLTNDTEYQFSLEAALGDNTPFVYSSGVSSSATPERVKVLSITENFDTSCPTGIPDGWVSFSNGSNLDWSCQDEGGGDYAMEGNGFGGDAPAEDWLIMPRVDLPAGSTAELSFDFYTQFGDAAGFGLDIKISTDYSGSGDPTAATWTSLNAEGVDNVFTLSAVYKNSTTSLASYAGSSVYVAFHYTSSGTGVGTALRARINNVSIKQPLLNEKFDDSCPDGIPSNWVSFSNGSSIDWSCQDEGDGDYAMEGNGFGGDAPAEDWLITPMLELPMEGDTALSFDFYTQFGDAADFGFDVRISTDYSGSGDPTTATWTSLEAEGVDNVFTLDAIYKNSTTSLASYAGNSIYVAFHYTSSGTGVGTALRARINNVKVK